MWINKLIYIAVLIYAGVLALLYTNVQSLYVFLILLLFGVLQAAVVVYLKKKIVVSLSVPDSVVNKNEPMKVSIVVDNKAIIPVSCVKVIVSYENTYEHLKQYQTFNLSVDSKSTQTINFTLSSVHTGTVQVGLKKVYIYDFLRIFHHTYRKNGTVGIKVFPEVCMMESNPSIAQQDFLDSEIFSKTKSGDDPSEVFDIREYKEGDKIHRIHWKLSSKRDVVMVKEYSLPIACNIGIMVSLELRADIMDRMQYYDALLSVVASISYQLLMNEQLHFITWYEEKRDNYVCASVENLDELYSAIYQLLEVQTGNGENKIISMHHAVGERIQVGKLYYICGKEGEGDQGQLEALYSNSQVQIIEVVSEENAEDALKAVENLNYQYIGTDSYKEGIEALQL